LEALLSSALRDRFHTQSGIAKSTAEIAARGVAVIIVDPPVPLADWCPLIGVNLPRWLKDGAAVHDP